MVSNDNQNCENNSVIKKIQCEVCGSTDVKKIDDTFFECQYCGMKYTKEEIRKLFINISGTVKVDNSDKLANLYQIARIEISKSNFENAQKYYDSILALEPLSWEAHFYSAYCRFWNSKQIEGIYPYREYAKCFGVVLDAINTNVTNKAQIKDLLAIIYDKTKEIADHSRSYAQKEYDNDIARGPKLYNDDIVSIFEFKMEQKEQVMEAKTEYVKTVSSGIEVMAKLGDEIKRVFANDDELIKKYAVKAWKYYVTNLLPLYNYIPKFEQANVSIYKLIEKYEDKIMSYDSSYVSKVENISASSNNPVGIITKQDKNSPEFKARQKKALKQCFIFLAAMLLIPIIVVIIYNIIK